MTDWSEGNYDWRLIENGLSESSSVETLRSVPVVNLFPAHLRVGNRIGMGLVTDWWGICGRLGDRTRISGGLVCDLHWIGCASCVQFILRRDTSVGPL